MEPTVNDAVGQPLAAGDVVAQVSRRGSYLSIERRRIASIVSAGSVRLVPVSGTRRPPCFARNLVRIAQGGSL